MTTCTACGRVLTRSPVMLGGMPYGPVCGAKAKPQSVPLGPDLFTGIDTTGDAIKACEKVRVFADEAGDRHIREMRAAWRAAA